MNITIEFFIAQRLGNGGDFMEGGFHAEGGLDRIFQVNEEESS